MRHEKAASLTSSLFARKGRASPASLLISELETGDAETPEAPEGKGHRHAVNGPTDRKSVVSGKSVSVRVDLGGRRIIKKKQKKTEHIRQTQPSRHKHHNVQSTVT